MDNNYIAKPLNPVFHIERCGESMPVPAGMTGLNLSI
jgi:hypothetical protein